MNLDWLAGLIDGEGCFAAIIIADNGLRIGYRIQPHFKIGMIDTEEILWDIYDFLLTNGTKLQTPRYGIKSKHWGKKAKPQAALQTASPKSCKKLANLLEGRLKTHKKYELIVWKKIIDDCIKKKHLTKNGFMEMMDSVELLRSYRTSRRIVYTKEYFKKLWNM